MLVDEDTRVSAREELFAHISDRGFPCVGAKSALAQGTLKAIVGHSLESAWDDVRIHSELLDWAAAYRREPGGLLSLAVVFEGPREISEERFERAMWERIQSLADKDEWRGADFAVGGRTFVASYVLPDGARGRTWRANPSHRA